MTHKDEIAWLVGLRLQSVIIREFDWVVDFDKGARLTIECLWRLTEADRIRVTSVDDGHQFGLPAPVNAAAEATRLLAGTLVESVEISNGTLDLGIRFENGCALQVIPTSAGYEAWNLGGHNSLIIAVGGGDLTIFRDPRDKPNPLPASDEI